MTIYNEDKIEKMYDKNLEEARRLLSSMKISTDEPNLTGLNGWVYEQLIQFLIKKELKALGFSKINIDTQQQLSGRKKVDLVINDKVAIEIKSRGLFGHSQYMRYRNYIRDAKKKHGWKYLYITGQEGYESYKKGTIKVFSSKNCFFLDKKGQWDKFVKRIVEII